MEPYIQMLDHLIELKKTKKEPNNIESSHYAQSWKELCEKEGYSERAESYLYKGLIFRGAAPLKDYMKESGKELEILQQVFAGKEYGTNLAAKSTILFHLLALYLDMKSTNLQVIVEIIRKIPAGLKNKEGKFYGQAWRPLKKYLLERLHCEQLPAWNVLFEAGLKPEEAKEFCDSIWAILNSMPVLKFSKKCQNNIKLLQIWMKEFIEPEQPEEAKKDAPKSEEAKTEAKTEVKAEVKTEAKAEDKTDVKPQIDTKPEETSNKENEPESALKVEPEAKPEPKPEPEVKLDMIAEYKEKALQLSSENQSLKEETAALKAALSEKEADINSSQVQIKAMKSENDSLKVNLQSRRDEINRLHIQIQTVQTELNHKIEDIKALTSQLQDKESEAADMQQFIDMLSEGQWDKVAIALNRAAENLKGEYADFISALSIPMTIELGENMRKQLKKVFEILNKSGVKL